MALNDLSTAVFLSLFNLIFMVLIMYSWGINRNIPGIGWWAAGISGLSLGLILLIVRYFHSSELIAISGSVVQILGAGAVVYGCSKFVDHRLNTKLAVIFLSGCSILAAVLALKEEFFLNTITVNIIFMIIYIRGGLLLISARRGGVKGGFVLVYPFLGLAVFHCYVVLSASRLWNAYFQELSLGSIYFTYSIFISALVMTLVQQGYFKFWEILSERANEKEMLFREMNHRTKNNLALINSMVALDSMYVNDPEALEILKILQNKINTVMLLHQQLQNIEAASLINAREYLSLVVDSFSDFSISGSSAVSLEKEIEPVELDVSTAIPIGLILNELITNCRKHAFSGGGEGNIHFSLKHSGKEIVVAVTDDGKGIQDQPRTGSLGLSLVGKLTKQLKGEFRLENRGGGTSGTRAVLLFPYEKKTK